MKGWVITRAAADGTKRYDACWWIGSKKKSKTFTKKKAAESYLTTMVGRVQDGSYVEIRPTLMGEVFDQWLTRSLDVRVQEGSLLIRVAALSGLRRGELFALQWADVDPGTGQDGGCLHVRRRIYQGVLDTPKTEGSDRVVDVPQRLLDDLAVYRVMHPPIGEGFIFRTEQGQPLDADNWHKRCLVPILERAKLRLPKSGLHSLRHSYVSLLAAQGEDIHYIAAQVGHSSTRLTQDVYRHVFAKTRTEAMRRLNSAIPSGNYPAESAGTAGTGGVSEE